MKENHAESVCVWGGLLERFRPHLKIIVFPVDRPGEIVSAGRVLSFFFWLWTFFFLSFRHFLYHLHSEEKQSKRREDFPASRLAIFPAICPDLVGTVPILDIPDFSI